MHQNLLVTKISIPYPGPSHIPRPRLFQVLDEGLRLGKRLVLVCAPAGYGKTTLISGWLQSRELPAAWLSLDERDNDPVRFLSYLNAAINVARPEVGEFPPILHSPEGAFEPDLVYLLNGLANTEGQFLIVLDDYHTINIQPIHEALAFFVQNLPTQIQVLIASRADPLLPLARWRARDQLLEVRLSELRFRLDETTEFINEMQGFSLTAEEISGLNSRMEGWVAGLQMAVLSLRAKISSSGSKAISGGLHSFPDNSRYILDYFSEEVLQRLPQYIQSFLEQTSILESLCGSLCDEVIGDLDRNRGDLEEVPHLQEPVSGTEVLEYLERLNLFIIPLDEQREWYRYHRLFADLLNQRLFHAQPAMLPVLHQRASTWYARNQLLDEAIQHAFAAGEVDCAADLIQTAAEATLMRSEITTFRSWIERLPETEILQRPDLAVYTTLTQLWGGAPMDVIETSLAQIEKGKLSTGKDAPLRAFIALNRGEISKAREYAIQALEYIPESDVLLRGLADLMRAICHVLDGEVQQGIRWLEKAAIVNRRTGNIMVAVLVLYQLAELNQKEGRLHQAYEFYLRALELATDTRGEYLPVAGRALVGMGEIAWAWNDLEAANKSILHGIELSERWSHVSTFDGYLALAAIQQSKGDIKGASRTLRTLREIAQLYDITDIDDLVVDLFEARLNINRGGREAVRQWAKRRGLEEWRSGWVDQGAGGFTAKRLHKYEVLVAARMWLAEGRPEETLGILDQQLVELDNFTRPALVIETELLRAQAFQEKKEMELAVQALEHALSMAEPEGFVRVFIDEGEKLRVLCKKARNKIHVESLRSFLDELLLAFPSGHKSLLRHKSLMTDLLIEPLSDREIHVLRLLPSSLSNQEIADELFISIHTLRSHLKSIYTKLGVHSRLEAIEMAGKLRLL